MHSRDLIGCPDSGFSLETLGTFYISIGYGWQRPLKVFGDLLSVPQCIVLPHQRLPKKFQAPQKAKSIEGVAVFG